jgi:hypothetical protein
MIFQSSRQRSSEQLSYSLQKFIIYIKKKKKKIVIQTLFLITQDIQIA